jgi:hypothetical protein
MGGKPFQVLRDCVEPQLERLEGQPKLFASGDSLNVTEDYEGLDKVEGRCTVEARPIGDLPQRERGFRRRERLQDAESVNQCLRDPCRRRV